MFNPSRLHKALAAHLGQELTPEVAMAVCLALSDGSPIAINAFEPIWHEGYSIGLERFADILPELHRLHEAHWKETERHRHEIALDPDYASARLREKMGELLQFTVRRDTELVGNLRMYIARSTHSRTLFAEEDTLYLLPEHRGGFLALKLLRYAEDVLRALGVREIRANSKLVNRADVLMRRMGYTAVATQFVKMIEVTHV